GRRAPSPSPGDTDGAVTDGVGTVGSPAPLRGSAGPSPQAVTPRPAAAISATAPRALRSVPRTAPRVLRSGVPGTSEPQIAGGRVGRGRRARGAPVAVAVGGVAEVGPAAHHPRAPGRRPGRVVGAVGRRVGGEPVGAPLPDVAADLVE